MEPNVFCIKNSRYKLIFMKTPNEWKLFDLIKDPNELNNIIDENLEIVTELKNKLNTWMER